MFTDAMLLTLYAETPLHVGGAPDDGIVDAPIRREPHTGYPFIPGSGIKGVLRAAVEEQDEVLARGLFGAPAAAVDPAAGTVAFTDARILLQPQRSIGAAFAWTTSSFALERLRRDLAATTIWPASMPEGALMRGLPGTARGCAESPHRFSVPAPAGAAGGRIDVAILEDEQFTMSAEPIDSPLIPLLQACLPAEPCYDAFRSLLARQLVVLDDSDFARLSRKGTERVQRVALTAEKTPVKGALWSEELLPAESLLYAMVYGTGRGDGRALERLSESIDGRLVQMGGLETIGRGWLRLRCTARSGGAR